MNFNMDLMKPYREEVKQALLRTVDSGWYLGGEESVKFEEEFATLIGQRYAVGVGNGTDAIRIALLALGIGTGDEVITPAFCVGFTALAIAGTGATPVFADCAAGSMQPDIVEYAKRLTPRTRAIVPVDIFGEVLPGVEVLVQWAHSKGLVVVEDAAHAHGHGRVGYGDATAFSFYPTKNLGALGEAGAITTNIPAVAERARLLRDGGRTSRYVHVPPGGLNSMLDDVQAAVLRVKMRHLHFRNQQRRLAAYYYRNKLGPIAQIQFRDYTHEDVHHLYVLVAQDRDGLRATLKERGIPTLIHYPLAVPLQPVFVGENFDKEPWPNAEKLSREVVSLPLHADITREEQNQVIAAIWAHYAD